MKQTIDVINRMEADGIIGRYALAGAVAAYNYIEPALTSDLDILVSFFGDSEAENTGLVSLAPIFSYLRSKGYDEHRKEGIVIESWPVQFLPVTTPLDTEALGQAPEIEFEIDEGAIKTRILRPEHLVAIALRVGRPQDFIRIAQFLEENAVNLTALCAVLDRHQLIQAWQAFCQRTGIADPCALHS